MITQALTFALLTVITSSQDSTYAFVDVAVVAMDLEGILEHRTVIVRDGRIVEISPTGQGRIPQDAVRIDGRGKYLIPGLAEMHAHIPSPPRASIEFAEEVLFLYVANGVTTIRGMLGSPAHLRFRERIKTGELLGPHIWTSSPSVNGNSVKTVEAADSAARASKEAGYDFIKIHPGLSRAAFDQLDATSDHVRITFSGHVPTDVGLTRALEAPYATIDHLDGYMEAMLRDDAPVRSIPRDFFGAGISRYVDDARITEIARLTKAAGVWNVPTQTLLESFATTESPEQMAARPEIAYISPQMRDRWMNWKRQAAQRAPDAATLEHFIEVRRRLIRALHTEGAGLLLGSDAPQVWNVPGFSVWHELQAMVRAGLTPYEALETGTVNVAKFFEVETEAGTIAVGKRADLVLLDTNPLVDLSQVGPPAGVMLHGRWLPRATLQARLAKIAAKYEN